MLECELSAAVLSQIKPSEDLEGVTGRGWDVAFGRGRLRGPITCGQNSHSEVNTTERHLGTKCQDSCYS